MTEASHVYSVGSPDHLTLHKQFIQPWVFDLYCEVYLVAHGYCNRRPSSSIVVHLRKQTRKGDSIFFCDMSQKKEDPVYNLRIEMNVKYI